MWFWWRKSTCNQTHIFSRRFPLVWWSFPTSHDKQSSSWRILVVFLDMRRYKNWANKISFCLISDYLKSCPAIFLGKQSASFLLSTLNSFGACWRSAAAASQDLILVEIDGKHPRQEPICAWRVFNGNHQTQTREERIMNCQANLTS